MSRSNNMSVWSQTTHIILDWCMTVACFSFIDLALSNLCLFADHLNFILPHIFEYYLVLWFLCHQVWINLVDPWWVLSVLLEWHTSWGKFSHYPKHLGGFSEKEESLKTSIQVFDHPEPPRPFSFAVFKVPYRLLSAFQHSAPRYTFELLSNCKTAEFSKRADENGLSHTNNRESKTSGVFILQATDTANSWRPVSHIYCLRASSSS